MPFLIISRTEHIRKAIDKAAGEALKMAQIQYHEINLNGGAFERALLWKLNWSSLTYGVPKNHSHNAPSDGGTVNSLA